MANEVSEAAAMAAMMMLQEIQDNYGGGNGSNKKDFSPTLRIVPEVKMDSPPTLVNVTVPVPEVNVTVPVPQVNISQIPAPKVTFNPQINIPPTVPVGYVVSITKRDSQGLIEEFTLTPLVS